MRFSHIPLRYTISAPLGQVLPIVPQLLSEADPFGLDHQPGRKLAWRLHRRPGDRTIVWLVFRSAPHDRSEFLAIPVRGTRPDASLSHLIPALATIVVRLRERGLPVAPKDPPAPALPLRGTILLAAPSASFDAVLATGLELVANQYRFVFRRLPDEAEGDPVALLAGQPVALVIADVASDAGRSVMEAAVEQQRRLVPIAPEGATVPAEWQPETLVYGENRSEFLQAMRERIAPDAPPEPPPVAGAWRASDRTTALDPRVAPARRFRAARVLATHGDHETAALALADVARAATPLRDAALDRLGRLGEAARVGLWLLDAGEENPARSVAIARELFRAGDATTARLRLEALTRHPDRHVRLEALHVLSDLGATAQPEFVRLLCREEDPCLQLEAARWLRLHRIELPRVITTLATLAGQPDRPRLALNALHELAAIRAPRVLEVLVDLAYRAFLDDVRLAAVQALSRRGEAEAARAVLLAVAGTQGSDQPGEVRLQAAHSLVTLDGPGRAVATLTHLVRSARDEVVRRWAITRLAGLGAPAVAAMFELLDTTEDQAIGLQLAEGILQGVIEPPVRRRAIRWLVTQAGVVWAAELLVSQALDPSSGEHKAHAALTDLTRLALVHPSAVQAVVQLAHQAPIASIRRRAGDFLLRHDNPLPAHHAD